MFKNYKNYSFIKGQKFFYIYMTAAYNIFNIINGIIIATEILGE